MNKKILVILATSTLLVTSLAASVGCASKMPAATNQTTTTSLIQTSVAETDTQPTENTTEETLKIKQVSSTDAETVHTTPETTISVSPNSKNTNSGKATKKVIKKTSKKTTKTVKKTTKKTTKAPVVIKNTEPTKNTDATKNTDNTKNTDSTKSTKKTVKAKFTYGYSVYYYGNNMAVQVRINKDNTAEFTVAEIKHNDPEMQYEIYWSGKGKVDPETNTLTYRNSTKKMLVKTCTGKDSNIMYTSGGGTIKFSKNSLKWNDQQDHKGNNYKFVKQ